MSENQPNWNQIAEKFDLWLPYIGPVTPHLLAGIDPGYGETLLDVACGTGEPALTLARRVGDATIHAVDAAEGMVNVAKAKAEDEGLTGIHFGVMPAEKLDFSDDHFDAVTCRFGVMLFDNPAAGLKEMQRVLKPAGRVALSVWGATDTLSSFKITADIIDPLVPEGSKTPLGKITSLGTPGVLEAAMAEAGFNNIVVETHPLTYTFDGFDGWWQLVMDSAILSAQMDLLSASQKTDVKAQMEHRSRDFLDAGRLIFPHTFRVASATK